LSRLKPQDKIDFVPRASLIGMARSTGEQCVKGGYIILSSPFPFNILPSFRRDQNEGKRTTETTRRKNEGKKDETTRRI